MQFEMRTYTVGEIYAPAMKAQTEAEADEIFEALVEYDKNWFHISEEYAVWLNKKNLKFLAGMYSDETQERVVRLFHLEKINPFEGDYNPFVNE